MLTPGALTLIFEDGGGAKIEMDARITGERVVLEPFPSNLDEGKLQFYV